MRAVVTGGTRGIGRALVEGFAAGGHTVAACGRSATHIQELESALGAPHRFAPVDVADADAVDAWASDVLEAHGPPDLLINNAALINAPTPLWEVDGGEFVRLMDVNVNGTLHVIRAFLPAMMERGSGVVVNFSSGWGRSTSPGMGPYCASKHAIEGLTSALAQDLPEGLAAVTLSPGTVDTDMLRTAWGSGAGHSPDPRTWAARALPRQRAPGTMRRGAMISRPRPVCGAGLGAVV